MLVRLSTFPAQRLFLEYQLNEHALYKILYLMFSSSGILVECYLLAEAIKLFILGALHLLSLRKYTTTLFYLTA